MRTTSRGRSLHKAVKSKEDEKQETPFSWPFFRGDECLLQGLVSGQIPWAANVVKSWGPHRLQVPRPKERRQPLKKMKTETRFLHYPIWVLSFNAWPLSKEHFPRFGAITSFPAQSTKMSISFTSPQADAGMPNGFVSPYKLNVSGQCRILVWR